MNFKKVTLLIVGSCFIFTQSAFAARMGGGRSYGMQRSMSKPSYSSNNNAQQRYAQPQQTMNNNSNTAQPQRSGMGVGTAAGLGALAGAAGGYMLAKSGQENNGTNAGMENASGTVSQAQSATSPSMFDSIPWGTIAILAALLAFGLVIFRKKTDPKFNNGTNNPLGNSTMNTYSSPLNMPNIKQQSAVNMQNTDTRRSAKQVIFGNKNNIMPPIDEMNKMDDGIETIYFLRQVKGMFLHIQSMNSLENINEVAKYMTPTLYQELHDKIRDNSAIADFSQLDCELIEANMSDDKTQLIASVKFFGLVSENPGDAPVQFSEIWNFVKTDLTAGKWLVAGIQQIQ